MRAARVLDALAALAAAALCAIACRNGVVVAIPAALAALSLLARVGFRADFFGQIAASLVAGALPGYLAANILERYPPYGVLEPTPGSVAVALLGAACVRPMFALGRSGGVANSALVLCALVAVGQAKLGVLYAALAALAGGLSLAARSFERRPVNTHGALSRRDVSSLAVIAAITASLTLLGAWGLPAAHRWSMQRLFDRYSQGRSESGLSDHMSLSAMDGVFQSDTVVLRVRGRRTDYLRGVVFDRYRLGAWSYTGRASRRPMRYEQRARGMQPGETELRRVGGPSGWMFAPLEAAAIATPDPALETLPAGVLRTSGDGDVLWFRAANSASEWIEAPTAVDRDVPRVLRTVLTATAHAWGCDTGEPEARARCLERTLRRDYRYSLTVPTSRRSEPIAAFLTQHKQGHCEYFATALALLARTVGVPSRLVAGYRVSERSEWGDFYTVRERNSHSWVEVHLPERGWTRLDATPPSLEEVAARHKVSALRAAFEWLRWRATDAFDQMKSRGVLKWAIGALALILGASVLQRALRQRWAARARTDAAESPAALRELFAALRRAGLERPAAESIERFAERVLASELDATVARATHEALSAYARERYGGERTAETDAALREVAERIREATAR